MMMISYVVIETNVVLQPPDAIELSVDVGEFLSHPHCCVEDHCTRSSWTAIVSMNPQFPGGLNVFSVGFTSLVDFCFQFLALLRVFVDFDSGV